MDSNMHKNTVIYVCFYLTFGIPESDFWTGPLDPLKWGQHPHGPCVIQKGFEK